MAKDSVELESMAEQSAVNRPPGIRAKWLVGDQTIGIGKIELLEKIEQHGSISAAAREMGMGYRRAWTLLDSLQRCFFCAFGGDGAWWQCAWRCCGDASWSRIDSTFCGILKT